MKRFVLPVAALLLAGAVVFGQAGAPVPAPGVGRGAVAVRQITLFDRQGKVVARVGDPGPFTVVSLSPDAKRVATPQGGAIWVYEVGTGNGASIAPGPGSSQPVWSVDGKRIAYQAARSGVTGFYQILSDGSGKEELLYGNMTSPNIALTGWSSEGSFFNYQVTDRATGTGSDMWVLSAGGVPKPVLILGTTANELGSRISPDGRFIGYRSDESGRNEIYVRPFDPTSNPNPPVTSEKWKISVEGSAGMIRWKSDGTELYFLSSNGGIMGTDITTTPAFKAGTPKLLFQTPVDFPLTGTPGALADVSADGQTFALLTVPSTQMPAR